MRSKLVWFIHLIHRPSSLWRRREEQKRVGVVESVSAADASSLHVWHLRVNSVRWYAIVRSFIVILVGAQHFQSASLAPHVYWLVGPVDLVLVFCNSYWQTQQGHHPLARPTPATLRKQKGFVACNSLSFLGFFLLLGVGLFSSLVWQEGFVREIN